MIDGLGTWGTGFSERELCDFCVVGAVSRMSTDGVSSLAI